MVTAGAVYVAVTSSPKHQSCATVSGEIRCTITSDSVTDFCTTLPNSVGCSDSNGGGSCYFIEKGGLLLFHVVNDSGVPLKGISVQVEYVSPFCRGVIVFTSTEAPLITNGTGWASYHKQVVGEYSFTVEGSNKAIAAVIKENMSTLVSVRIPSYTVTTIFQPYAPSVSSTTAYTYPPACGQTLPRGIYLRAVSDSGGAPLSGVPVKASPVSLCHNVETVTPIILRGETNSSGSLQFPGYWGNYYKVTVTFSGRSYNFNVPNQPHSITVITIRLPSGTTDTSYSA